MENYSLSLITGTDIPIPECQVILHQPVIKDIAYIGEEDFFIGIQCLCLYKNAFIEDEKVLSQINNFQIFMMIMNDKESRDKKKAVQKVLQLLFPDYKILFTPNSLILSKKDSENVLIDENNFEPLQAVIRSIFCQNRQDGHQNFNPADAKAKKIADKIKRGRQKVAAIRSKEQGSIFVQYVSVLSVGLHLSPLEVIKWTLFQLYDIIERYSIWINWDIDIRSRLAGAKNDKPVDNWMRNIHKDN